MTETTGDVKVTVDYTKQDGTNGDTLYGTTDGSKLNVVDESDVINNVTSVTNLIDSTSERSAATTLQIVNSLFDNNASTGSDFRIGSNNSGTEAISPLILRKAMQLRFRVWNCLQDKAPYLAELTEPLSKAPTIIHLDDTHESSGFYTDWQTLSVSGNDPYRYIRIFNGNAWYGNMSEVKFHGKVESLTKIQSASISSPQVIMNRIVPGNTVNVAFIAKEPIKDVKVAIQGQDATESSTDNINWTATAVMNQGVAAGPVKFTINYNKQDGTEGYPKATQTRDNTSLYLVDESDVINNVTSIANLMDSTSGRTATQTLQQVNALFDSNAGTGSDFRNDRASEREATLSLTLKQAIKLRLPVIELLARQDQYYTRINGAVIQAPTIILHGTTLTKAADLHRNWQTLDVSSKVPYRYIRDCRLEYVVWKYG